MSDNYGAMDRLPAFKALRAVIETEGLMDRRVALAEWWMAWTRSAAATIAPVPSTLLNAPEEVERLRTQVAQKTLEYMIANEPRALSILDRSGGVGVSAADPVQPPLPNIMVISVILSEPFGAKPEAPKLVIPRERDA